MRATLAVIRKKLMRRRHKALDTVGPWLNRVVQRYFNCYAVADLRGGAPGNRHSSCNRVSVLRLRCTLRRQLRHRQTRLVLHLAHRDDLTLHREWAYRRPPTSQHTRRMAQDQREPGKSLTTRTKLTVKSLSASARSLKCILCGYRADTGTLGKAKVAVFHNPELLP